MFTNIYFTFDSVKKRGSFFEKNTPRPGTPYPGDGGNND
jgi:hypothetical protein